MAQIKRGDIMYIDNAYTVGSEQRAGRPAVIISNDKNNQNSSTVEVVYLTTQPKHDLPTHVTIRSTGRVSTAICEQITTVAVERLRDHCGHVTDSEMQALETAMMISLGCDYEPVIYEEREKKEPPVQVSDFSLAEALADAESRCRLLQDMYNSLLDRLVRAG